MTTPELLQYIRSATAEHVPKEQIYAILKENGWQYPDINEGFAALGIPVLPPHAPSSHTKKVPQATPPPMPTSQQPALMQTAPASAREQTKQKINASTRKGSRLVAIIAVAAVSIVLLLGIGVFAYLHFFVTDDNTVLTEAISNQLSLQSFSAHTTIHYSAKKDLPAALSFLPSPMTATATIDTIMTDNGAAALSATLAATTTTDHETQSDIGAIRFINNTLYAHADSLPSGASSLSPLFTIMQSAWVSATSTDHVPLPFIPQEARANVSSLAQDASTTNAAISLLGSDPIVSVAQRQPDESIDGTDSYHYLLALNPSGVQQYYADLGRILRSQYSNVLFSDAQLQEYVAIVGRISSAINSGHMMQFDVWISKKTHLFTKISLGIFLDQARADDLANAFNNISASTAQNTFPTIATALAASGSALLTINTTFAGQDQAQTISTPSSSTAIADVLPVNLVASGTQSGTCGDLPNNMRSCTPYTCTIPPDPHTPGGSITITGTASSTCAFSIRDTSSNTTTTCHVGKQDQTAFANFFQRFVEEIQGATSTPQTITLHGQTGSDIVGIDVQQGLCTQQSS